MVFASFLLSFLSLSDGAYRTFHKDKVGVLNDGMPNPMPFTWIPRELKTASAQR